MSMINLMLGRAEHEKTFNSLWVWSISIFMQILYKPFADILGLSILYIKGLQITMCFMIKLLKYPEQLSSQGRFLYTFRIQSLHTLSSDKTLSKYCYTSANCVCV